MGPRRADSHGVEKGPARLQATGQPAKVDLHDVFNAILCVSTGIPWKYPPHDFPNHGTVYATWRDEVIFAQINYDLTGLARAKKGRKPEPTASVIDTQSVKTSTNVPLTSQGTVTGTPASLSGNALGIRLLNQVKKTCPSISKSWVETDVPGFHVVKRRWVVERSLGWIMQRRRLTRGYETLPAGSEVMIHIASIDNLTKRIAEETTQTWRETY